MKRRSGFGLILSSSLIFSAGLTLGTASKAPRPRQAVTGASQASASVPGESATVLPDGRWLLLGGEGAEGPLATASLRDPQSGAVTILPNGLLHPRAWHTATVLPDGSVLVLGGIGANGSIVDVAERFDPPNQRFGNLPPLGLAPRAHHTATVLTDGRVLIAGGTAQTGETLGELGLWDPRTGNAASPAVRLLAARRDHTATLLPDGTVLFWGGRDSHGLVLNFGEVFDPETLTVRMETAADQFGSANLPPRVEASLPPDGAENVPVDTLIALRFSKPLSVVTVSTQTVSLTGPQGIVEAKVVPAERGMLAFVTSKAPLASGTSFTLSLNGLTDQTGLALPNTILTFSTSSTAGAQSGGEVGLLGAGSSSNVSTSQALDSPFRKLPPLKAPPGVTALAGQTLKLDGQPLEGVTIRIDNESARTEGTGRFLVFNITGGHHVMIVDGQFTDGHQKNYGIYTIGVDVVAGKTNVLPFTIWMPVVDPAYTVHFSSPTSTEVVVTTPLIPGLEVHIPANDVFHDVYGNVVTSMNITPIPMEQMPFPGPPGVMSPISFTLQPSGTTEDSVNGTSGPGIRTIFPNASSLRPGSKVTIYSYNPETELGWFVVGQGTVTPDGKQIIPAPELSLIGSPVLASPDQMLHTQVDPLCRPKAETVSRWIWPRVFSSTRRPTCWSKMSCRFC